VSAVTDHRGGISISPNKSRSKPRSATKTAAPRTPISLAQRRCQAKQAESDAAVASEKGRAEGPRGQALRQAQQAVIDRVPTAKRRRHNLGPKAYEEPLDEAMPHQKKPGPTPEGVDPGRAPTADYASLYAGRA
jgi:hypothetical protein